ncbi:MAG: hypothetical protein QXD59_08125 [Candidatus Caldarchaeum sp.]
MAWRWEISGFHGFWPEKPETRPLQAVNPENFKKHTIDISVYGLKVRRMSGRLKGA